MLTMAVCSTVAAQQTTKVERQRALNDIAAHRSTLVGIELRDALREGLRDADPGLRQRALLAIASRAGGPRFGESETINHEWRADHPIIVALRPLVVAALADIDQEVRHAAVLALGNMDFDLQRPTDKQISVRLVDDLAKLYAADLSGRVRTEVVKAFALSSNESKQVRDVITRALEDPQSGARQFAAKAAARLKHSDHLSKLVVMLQLDREKSVRFMAAMALAAYGPTAARYETDLQTSRQNERDSDVQYAIDRAIKDVSNHR